MITFVFKKNAYLFKDQFYLDTVSYKDIVTVVVLKTCTQDLNAETIIGSIDVFDTLTVSISLLDYSR